MTVPRRCFAGGLLARDDGKRQPGFAGELLDGLGKERPSVSITKSKMLPFLPAEKSNQRPFWSLTKKDGVFSGVKGERPRHSRPSFFSRTLRPTTADTGRRARSSSRKPA